MKYLNVISFNYQWLIGGNIKLFKDISNSLLFILSYT